VPVLLHGGHRGSCNKAIISVNHGNWKCRFSAWNTRIRKSVYPVLEKKSYENIRTDFPQLIPGLAVPILLCFIAGNVGSLVTSTGPAPGTIPWQRPFFHRARLGFCAGPDSPFS
jgi:hypothetical protein